MLFPFLTVFIIFLLFLAFRYHKLSKLQEEKNENFWERERNAAATVKPEIDKNELLIIPLAEFPLGRIPDAKVQELELSLTEAARLPMKNLSNKTNTELKEEYGSNHLAKMQQYGENYNEFMIILRDYCSYLITLERYDLAIPFLEFAAKTNCDISQIYKSLGDCYYHCNKIDYIEHLIRHVKSLHLVLENSILTHLNSLQDGHPMEDFQTTEQTTSDSKEDAL